MNIGWAFHNFSIPVQMQDLDNLFRDEGPLVVPLIQTSHDLLLVDQHFLNRVAN